MYYVVYGSLYLVSLLPMWLLYPLADALAFLFYHIIRYRRRVVMANLAIAFPGKPRAWRKQTARKFYRNFTDNLLETLKLISAGDDFARKRIVIDNPELLAGFYNSGRKCHLHLGHTFNWEIANMAMPLINPYPFIVAYMPIENKVLDRLLLKMRARTGSIMLPSTRLQRAILPYRNQQYLLTLVADQAPSSPETAYWLNFFGRPTAFLRGPERGARAGDIPAVFARFYRPRRGHYRVQLITIADHPAALREGELTLRYARLLEDAIAAEPALWLWTHKRWKKDWKEEFSRLRID
jgi:Kdo2-lipid IVA lauroyltransferase/acyltransferase